LSGLLAVAVESGTEPVPIGSTEQHPGAQEGSYFGFDFGLKRIGVAIGQSITRTATPLITLRCVEGRPPWDTLTRIIHDWQPDALVVGVPFTSGDGVHPLTDAARRFARQLKGRYQRPIYLVDERFSSVEAERILAARGLTALRRYPGKEAIDKVAATVILETWLATCGNLREPCP
jgi:RNAse H-fold protein YqgF